MAEDTVNLGAVQYQDLLSTGIEDLTYLKPIDIPVIDLDPYNPDAHKPSADSELTEDKLHPDVFKETKEELHKGFKGLFNLFTLPGKVYNTEKPITMEELIPQAVDMATTIIGKQLSKGPLRTRLKDYVPKPDNNIVY